ncbi:unnamed protein product [Arctia plantaginis]|uniref:Peptidoglycan recognition protein n=1 Tax=Arctia plantaginis TaxID=874455 RepID=A0A8S0YZZ8_ARCPL|nr:unnamed protein product [Arctia plantaginis]
MAQKINPSRIADRNLSIKVEGELDNFQIIEEKSDSDEDERTLNNSSRTTDLVSQIPSSLVKPSNSPSVCGTVSITNSDNVIIGNNTYFNGPVTIKQVIHSATGLDNPSYTKSEDENVPKPHSHHDLKDTPVKRFHIQRWHKITFSAICIIIIGGIFAILSIILNHNSHEDSLSSNGYGDDSSSKPNYTKVVGLSYESISLIIFTIFLVPLTFLLMFYTLLTLDGSGRNKKRREADGIEDNYDPYMRPLVTANPLIIAPDHLRIVSRTDWLAQPVEDKLDKIKQPVPWVIISHTATESCTTQSECVLRVRLIQTFHIESRKWSDIGYNFLVAGDGSAYFGRGWDYIGAHTLGYNKYSIGISFIGTFNNDPPPKKQLDACIKLLKRGVAIGKLDKNYKLFGHRQLASTLSPGDNLYDIIKHWPHFVKNFTDIRELLPNY